MNARDYIDEIREAAITSGGTWTVIPASEVPIGPPQEHGFQWALIYSPLAEG